MTKFTKIRKWANEKGYQVEDAYAYGNRPAIKVTVDEQHSFTCEEKESTVYYSVNGMAGDRGGLYMAHNHKPEDGRFVRPYSFWYQSQTDMITAMENYLHKFAIKEWS
jgi:hypothetical protein